VSDGLKCARDTARATRTGTPDVRPGQIWADNDPRSAGRTLRVDRITAVAAVCTILTNATVVQSDLDRGCRGVLDRRGKITLISLVRLQPTSTGYRLIEEN
jgi:hypothetical protein